LMLIAKHNFVLAAVICLWDFRPMAIVGLNN
jgi:hypothetical protein